MTYRYFREDKTASPRSPVEEFLFMGGKEPQHAGIEVITLTPASFGKKRTERQSGKKRKIGKGAG